MVRDMSGLYQDISLTGMHFDISLTTGKYEKYSPVVSKWYMILYFLLRKGDLGSFFPRVSPSEYLGLLH